MSFISPRTKNSPQCPHKPFPTGQGIGIAFLDTGITPMADFMHPKNRIIAFQDFINGKKTPYDDNGHGTHVAWLIKKEWHDLKNHTTLFLLKNLYILPFESYTGSMKNEKIGTMGGFISTLVHYTL